MKGEEGRGKGGIEEKDINAEGQEKEEEGPEGSRTRRGRGKQDLIFF
jgi:hypothetical protein